MSSHHSYPVESTGSIGSQDIWQLSRIIEMDHVWRESQTGWKSEQVNCRLRPAKCLADSLPSRCTLRFAQTFSNFCTVSTLIFSNLCTVFERWFTQLFSCLCLIISWCWHCICTVLNTFYIAHILGRCSMLSIQCSTVWLQYIAVGVHCFHWPSD